MASRLEADDSVGRIWAAFDRPRYVDSPKNLMKDDVLLVMSGFHLRGDNRTELKAMISRFKDLGVKYVGPCHCTGEAAKELFKEEYGEAFIRMGVGKKILLEDLK